MQLKQVLFFSLDDKKEQWFFSEVEKNRFSYEASFRMVEDHIPFNHTSDLLFFLDSCEKKNELGDLFVIVDYISFFRYDDQQTRYDSFSRAADIIRRAILKYPEVFFLFFEQKNKKGEIVCDYSDFLFDEWEVIDRMTSKKDCDEKLSPLVKEYHQFSWNEKSSPFATIISGRSALFDGSNLRYLLKRFLYRTLQVKEVNFNNAQNSRRDHLAICVEEERSQARFNGYVLYSCGYRVLPASSARELKYLNDNIQQIKPAFNNQAKDPVLIVRDYDLQFPDADATLFNYQEEKKKPKLVDLIRGVKLYDKDDNDDIPDGYGEGRWHKCITCKDITGKALSFWNHIEAGGFPQYFITKGKEGIRLCRSKQEFERVRTRENQVSKQDKHIENHFVDNVETQFLRGITKPVIGIYESILSFDEVRRVFLEQRDKSAIDTKRAGHSHGVPLDIYDLVKSMIDRAENYYQREKFLLSALVAREAIEILNGFHESMMLKAYHIQAVSENALAMNLLGGDERALQRDAMFRVEKIKEEVTRLLDRKNVKEEDRGKFKLNVLNQIFSDCRLFCKSKEHFLSEDVFISALGHTNEGINIWKWMKTNNKAE